MMVTKKKSRAVTRRQSVVATLPPISPPTTVSAPGFRLRLVAVFVAVLAAHFAWNTYVRPAHCTVPAKVEAKAGVPETGESAAEAQEQGEDQCTPSEEYFEAGNQWLGLSYAFGLTFVFYAWSRFRADRSRKAENATLGGLGITGLAYLVSCFLIGCCGSPMLGVWLGLLGPHFLPFARPLVLLITMASVTWGWWNLNRKSATEDCNCEQSSKC